MKKSIIIYLLFITIFLGFKQKFIFAEKAVSSTELIKNSQEYNGKEVIFRGEVIGDVMRRHNFAWVNLHDGDFAIGMWLSFDLAKSIIYTGGYQNKGDIFEVRGVFNRACSEHGGDLDIHALEFKKIKSGYPHKEIINPFKKKFALNLLGGLFIVWILTLLLKKRKNR